MQALDWDICWQPLALKGPAQTGLALLDSAISVYQACYLAVQSHCREVSGGISLLMLYISSASRQQC